MKLLYGSVFRFSVMRAELEAQRFLGHNCCFLISDLESSTITNFLTCLSCLKVLFDNRTCETQHEVSDILVLKIIVVLVFILFSSQNFYFI